MESLEDKISKLPPDLKKEVDQFVESLLDKESGAKEKKRYLSQVWGGKLEELSDKFTSSQLQQKSQ